MNFGIIYALGVVKRHFSFNLSTLKIWKESEGLLGEKLVREKLLPHPFHWVDYCDQHNVNDIIILMLQSNCIMSSGVLL